MRIPTLCLPVLLAVLAPGRPASADDAAFIREERPVRLALGFDALFVHDGEGDGGPMLRLGVNLSPRLALELTGGVSPRGPSGDWSAVGGGLSWFFGRGALAPHAVLRAQASSEHPDEGRDLSHLFVGAGLGLEYAGPSGVTLWCEALPALVHFDAFYSKGLRPGVLVSLGLGYRFRSPGLKAR
jgi:hypothetical protein